jgi:hypothetical protein
MQSQKQTAAQSPSPKSTVIKYRIAWRDSHGYEGHGQPIFSNEEEVASYVISLNYQHHGEIKHWVEGVEVEEE